MKNSMGKADSSLSEQTDQSFAVSRDMRFGNGEGKR
jgi:hypothetical protein